MNDFIDGRSLAASLLGTSCKLRTANSYQAPAGRPVCSPGETRFGKRAKNNLPSLEVASKREKDPWEGKKGWGSRISVEV